MSLGRIEDIIQMAVENVPSEVWPTLVAHARQVGVPIPSSMIAGRSKIVAHSFLKSIRTREYGCFTPNKVRRPIPTVQNGKHVSHQWYDENHLG